MSSSTTRTRWLTRSGVAVAVTALCAGISVAVSQDSPLSAPKASATERLARFSSCDEVSRWYVKQALSQVTAWGLNQPMMIAEDMLVTPSTRSAVGTSAMASGSSAVANGSTGTNVQEADVDEPDVAKTMGDLVVSVRHSQLIVTDVSGSEPVEVGRLSLPRGGWTYELLIVGDRAVVIGTSTSSYYGLMSRVMAPPYGYRGGANRSSVTTVDLTDPSAPSLVYREVVEGSVSTSREHDGTVRVVVTSTPSLDFSQPGRRLTERQSLLHNRQVVMTASAQDWLPQRDIDKLGRGGSPLLDCADVAHPLDSSGLGTITVLTLDPAAPASAAATSVAADGSLVYSSTDHLYVATVQGGWESWTTSNASAKNWRQPSTDIHAFDTEGTSTTYTASGTVPGVVPDRWAFSEYDGDLRVASSEGPEWSPRESTVTVLREQSGVLRRVGQVSGLGQDETIQAVRWFGDVAVVVTFRQMDPLYTIDLSDPTHPRVDSELKATGFSDYLHPIGGDLLLGVGQAATTSGRTLGAQVSTFTLSDPRLVARAFLGKNTWSPVGDDSRTFTYLPELRIALIPTTGWQRGTTGLNEVSVATDGSLHLVRTLYVKGWSADLRGLPLTDGRVAFVRNGAVDRILDLS